MPWQFKPRRVSSPDVAMSDRGLDLTLASVKRYGTLVYGSLGTMTNLGLLVLGSLLVGLSLAVLLGGLGLAAVEVGLTTGPMLASALVLAIVGLFCVGLASEGPLGRGRLLAGFGVWELGIGRIVALLLIGLAGLGAHDLLAGFVGDLPHPFHRGVSGVRAVSIAGMTAMAVVGVPLGLLTRHPAAGRDWVRLAEIPVMFVVWAVGTLIVL